MFKILFLLSSIIIFIERKDIKNKWILVCFLKLLRSLFFPSSTYIGRKLNISQGNQSLYLTVGKWGVSNVWEWYSIVFVDMWKG